MSKAKYVYIDDFVDDSIQAIRDGLRDTGIIDVDLEEVKEFKEQISSFENDFQEYDGAILDLRLDGNHKINVKYTATSLAQELRSRSAAGEGIKEIPLILCSTDEKIKALYNRDQTSHDLFDFAFKKDKRPDWQEIAKTLQSLANGYQVLQRRKNFDFIGRDISEIDDRVFSKFYDSEAYYPSHEIAQHIIKELFLQPGPLINDSLVAARLGVDIDESKDFDDMLSKFFCETKYKGVFCDGWERWWSDLISEIFRNNTGKRLSILKAEERVEELKSFTGLEQLKAAEPIEKNTSTNFWTVCEYFQKPLDPLEGFKIYTRKQQKPWQESRYLSFEAAAERLGHNEGLKIHPSEKERLEIGKSEAKN